MTAPARVLVGTCSWTDKTLTEETDWYPKKIDDGRAERLAFYAEPLPDRRSRQHLLLPALAGARRRGGSSAPRSGFTMNVKAYSLFTGHPTQPDSLWRDIRDDLPDGRRGEAQRLRPPPRPTSRSTRRGSASGDALRPLATAGKLGAVLMQYPKWFTPKRDEPRRARAGCASAWATSRVRRVPCADLVPVTDDRERTLDLLRDLRLALVVRRRAEGVEAADGARGRRPTTSRSCGSTAAPTTRGTTARAAPPSGSTTCTRSGSSGRGSKKLEQLADQAQRGPRADEQLLPGLRRAQRRRAAAPCSTTDFSSSGSVTRIEHVDAEVGQIWSQIAPPVAPKRFRCRPLLAITVPRSFGRSRR